MNLKLLPNRILVEEIEEKTDGVQIVKASKGSEARGRIAAISPYRDGIQFELTVPEETLVIGTIVHFVKGSGEELTHEGKNYRVLYVSVDRDSEVLAIEA